MPPKKKSVLVSRLSKKKVSLRPATAVAPTTTAEQAKEGGFASYLKAGFGITFGSVLAIMIFLAVAVGIFIVGFIMVKKESKKPKEQQNTTRKVVGFVLMGLAMVVGLGFGAPVFFGLLAESV